jgi:hypothetical protein
MFLNIRNNCSLAHIFFGIRDLGIQIVASYESHSGTVRP